MISPDAYRNNFEKASLKEILKERDALIREIRRYEKGKIPPDTVCLVMKMDKKVRINTERLCLRSFSDTDADAAIDILMNDEVGKTFMVPDFKSRDDAMRLFGTLRRLSKADDRFVYGIYLENNLIGFINDVEIDGDEIELGFAIHPDHWGNGYATEVLRASIRELLDMDYSVVKTGAFEENIASIRVMEKCSMTRLDKTDELEYRGKVHRCVWFEAR